MCFCIQIYLGYILVPEASERLSIEKNTFSHYPKLYFKNEKIYYLKAKTNKNCYLKDF
jgi:hypothetical protein